MRPRTTTKSEMSSNLSQITFGRLQHSLKTWSDMDFVYPFIILLVKTAIWTNIYLNATDTSNSVGLSSIEIRPASTATT